MSGSDSPTFFHGQPWSSWIERIGRDKPLSDDEPEAEPSSSVTRLSSDDIDLYGFCPERDTFYGVVCEICNAIIKPQALIQHMESRHSTGTVNLPPPSTPIVKPTVKTPYCKVSKLKRTQSSGQIQSSGKTNHSGTTSSSGALSSSSTGSASASTAASSSSIKRTAEQANLQNIGSLTSPRSPLETIAVQSSSNATTIVPSSPVKSPVNSGQPRRKRLKGDRGLLKDREYDADRHCGVWNDETGKPCTRSLTCKAHTVSLRRTVAGRSKAFDKLLAEHRAAKELPNRTPKVTLTGTVTVSTATNPTINVNSFLTTNTNISAANESEATPGSPPVLSLPDTYPLPKAVDLLYRCLAPHAGSAKPTKLEEDFVNEELRLESALANSSIVNNAKSMMAPISVVLPSLSPIASNNENTSSVATLIPATVATAIPTIATSMAVSRTLPGNVLDTGSEAPIEIDPVESMTLYSPVSVYKDAKSQIVVQLPRGNNNLIQSPRNYQPQASMPSLSMFEPVEQTETSPQQQPPIQQQQQLQPQQQQQQQQQQQHSKQMANGKRLNNNNNNNSHSVLLSPLSRHTKRSKHEYRQEFSTSIQVEATTTSTPYPHFSDIAWSNCHPEPLAVSRWLRITSNRKQYNFNIH